MEILLLKNVDLHLKMEILLFKNGDSIFQNGLLHFFKWEFYFLRMEILHFKIGNSTDILESKTNLTLYSQINSRKCRIY